ncbi:MAG: acetyl-CoA hydrolase/transferase family protein [Ilumatobacteraceae bacterium]
MGNKHSSLRLVSPADAVASLVTGARIVASPGCGSPTTLLGALNSAADRRRDLTVYSGLQLVYPFLDALTERRLRHVSWHVMPEIRGLVDDGVVDYMPTRASEVPHHLARWKVDTAFVRVSPPDAQGFVSLGPCGSYPIEAVQQCTNVVAEIDEHVPRTFGNRFPAERITMAVESESPMPRYESAPPTDLARKIAESVVELIPSGATIQVGIGAIPESILEVLAESSVDDLRFIGMGTDSMATIAARGKLAERESPSIVAVELMGGPRVMEFANENPHVRVVSSREGQGVLTLSRMHAIHSINSAIEIDLSGQVNAETVGTRIMSGVGGSLDFVESAYQSELGRRITVLASTAKGGSASSIVPTLGVGSATSIPRSLADLVVTEFGVADLRGKTMAERATELIAVSHPDFRDRLEQTRTTQQRGSRT